MDSFDYVLTTFSYNKPFFSLTNVKFWYNNLPNSNHTDQEENEMNTHEIAELLLVYLYDRVEAEAHSFFFFPLGEFADAANITDGKALLEAAQLLESRGFVMLSQDIVGRISALINMEGSSFVEEGGETGIIKKHRENPGTYIKVSDDPGPYDLPFKVGQFTPDMLEPQPPVQSAPPTAESPLADTKAFILDIMHVILEDVTLDEASRADLLRDADALNIQLAKTVKNKRVIEALMTELAGVPSVAPLVAQLSTLI
jgi:hypothetical protein